MTQKVCVELIGPVLTIAVTAVDHTLPLNHFFMYLGPSSLPSKSSAILTAISLPELRRKSSVNP